MPVRSLRTLVALSLSAAALAASALAAPAASAAPTATTSTGPVAIEMGAAAQDQAAFDAFDKQAGTFKSRRTYNSTLPSAFPKALAASDVAADRTSYWSFRPDPKTFPADTVAQAAFAKFLTTIPAGHQTVVIALHEPEDEIRDGKFTLKQWGDTNNVVGRLVKATNRPELRHGISLMGPWTFDSRSTYYSYSWESVLDFKLVDVVGIDPYKFRTTDPSLEQMLTKSNSGNGKTPNPSVMDKLSSWGKPIALTEFGVNAADRYTGVPIPDAVRGQWITDGYAWMNSWNATHEVKIEAAMYFQLHAGGPLLTGEAIAALDATTT
jgi:hypothetical protein